MADNPTSRILRDLANTLSGAHAQPKIAFTALGSELPDNQLLGAAAQTTESLLPVIIGPRGLDGYPHHFADNLAAAHRVMEKLLASGEVDGAVTLHYNFPLGVATVAQVRSVATGRAMLLTSTTGCMDRQRRVAMVKNAIAGLAVADALNVDSPTVGVLNVDDASAVVNALKQLAARGFSLYWANSVRGNGGAVMRGNDLIRATPDVMVCDTLTGNLLIKLFSAGFSGGDVETLGCGYGVALGQEQRQLVGIISRASGPATIAEAMRFCALMVQRKVMSCWQRRWQQACACSSDNFSEHTISENLPASSEAQVPCPPETVLDDEIHGIDILCLEEARLSLWRQGIYAQAGMGCTGPVLMVNNQQREQARVLLDEFLD